MATSTDRGFRIAVLAGAGVLVLLMTVLRFCGELRLPAKLPPPHTDVSADQLLATADASPLAWRGYVEKDAAAAGVAVPSPAAMARRLAYRVDEGHRALEPGDPPVEVAGLRLSAQVVKAETGDVLALVIENPGAVDLGYRVMTRPSTGTQICHSRPLLPYNAMVVAHGSRETRSECRMRRGLYLHVDRVETVEVGSLSAVYVSRVPPVAVGVEPRVAQGHRPLLAKGFATCNVVMSRSLQAELEQGRIGWRDLVDFYARHRCDTYQFPESYRAFTKDGERQLPAVR